MQISRYKHVLAVLFSVAALSASAISTAHAAQPEGSTIPEDALLSGSGTDTGERTLPPKDKLGNLSKDQTGTISVRLTDGKTGTSRSGIRFECIAAADIVDGEYVLDPAYESSGVDLNKIENSDEADNAAKKLAEYQIPGKTGETDQQGELSFPGLEVGVYLIKAEEKESYDMIAAALIAVPTWSESEGDMLYDVELVPKHTPRQDAPSPDETGGRDAPQTGLKDDTGLYLLCGGTCLLFSCLLAIWGVKRARGKRHGR